MAFPAAPAFMLPFTLVEKHLLPDGSFYYSCCYYKTVQQSSIARLLTVCHI